MTGKSPCIRRVWRYQIGNDNPLIEEEQAMEWPKEKGHNDNQGYIKYTTKDQVTQTPLKPGLNSGTPEG